MPRALTMRRSIVPHGDRKKFLEKLTARRAYYTGAHCRFWVFEESDLPGAFMEFVEADDADALAKAIAAAPDPVVDAVRIYEEVELS